MYGDVVDCPKEQRVVGDEAMLVVELQNGEGFSLKRGKIQTQPVAHGSTGRK